MSRLGLYSMGNPPVTISTPQMFLWKGSTCALQRPEKNFLAKLRDVFSFLTDTHSSESSSPPIAVSKSTFQSHVHFGKTKHIFFGGISETPFDLPRRVELESEKVKQSNWRNKLKQGHLRNQPNNNSSLSTWVLVLLGNEKHRWLEATTQPSQVCSLRMSLSSQSPTDLKLSCRTRAKPSKI